MDTGRSAALFPDEILTREEEACSLIEQVLEPGTRAAPYALYDRLRELAPVRLPDGTMVFASFAQCEAVLHAGAAVTDRAPMCPAAHAPRPRMAVFPLPDGPPELHGRLRELLTGYVTPPLLRAVSEPLRECADTLLDSVARRGRLEVVTDLAYPLPMALFALLLDVPKADATWLHRRCMALSPALDPHPAVTGAPAPGESERRQAEDELDRYFDDLVGSRRSHLGEDLLSRLIRAEASGLPADPARLARLLLSTGHESTASLISGSLLALVRSAHQRDAVRADPAHAASVVEDVLRTDPPWQLLQRYAATDLDICGTPVRKGTAMLLLLPAAHRDPARPHGGGAHLAFGRGPRACLGAPLAQLLATTAVVRFAQRVDGPRLAPGRPSYRRNVTLRGLRALWVDADSFGDRTRPWPRE